MTPAVSITEFGNRADEILDAVIEGDETIIITLPDACKFVLVPGLEWQRMDETAYLTSTTVNRVALSQSLEEAAERRAVEVEL